MTADHGWNRIDWVEHVRGLAGEVDDEEEVLLVCRDTGIWRINATQDTVTQITTETGFISCSYSRDHTNGG